MIDFTKDSNDDGDAFRRHLCQGCIRFAYFRLETFGNEPQEFE